MSEGMGYPDEKIADAWAKEIENVKKKFEHEADGKHIAVVVVGDGALKIANRSKKITHHFVKSVFITSHSLSADMDRVIMVGKGLTHDDCGCRGPHDEEVAESVLNMPDVVDKIEDAIKDTQIVLIVACLGGLTGSAGARKVAEIASNMGKFVIAIVVYPFSVEGKDRCARAETYGKEIEKYCNKYIVLRNDERSPETTLDMAMRMYGGAIDCALEQFIQAIDYTNFNKVVDELKGDHEISISGYSPKIKDDDESMPHHPPVAVPSLVANGGSKEVEIDILKE